MLTFSNAQLRPYTSEFQPREGVNFVKFKAGALPSSLFGTGPAVAVSLGEDEVRNAISWTPSGVF